jgi:nucleoside-diphosphate kinase
VFEGTNVIAGSRKLIGATNPADALHGTVRGDFCTETCVPEGR